MLVVDEQLGSSSSDEDQARVRVVFHAHLKDLSA